MPPKFLPADLKRERNKFRIAPFAGAFDLEMSNFFRDLNRELVRGSQRTSDEISLERLVQVL